MTTKLTKMSMAEIQDYLGFSIKEYGEHMFEAGEYPTREIALEASQKEIRSFYTNKRPGKEHFGFNILNEEDEKVGMLIITFLPRPEGRVGFIDYISIYEPYRRHGHAYNAMKQVEPFVLEGGLNIIDLNVLTYKDGARALYTKLGYSERRQWCGGFATHETRLDMRKVLQ